MQQSSCYTISYLFFFKFKRNKAESINGEKNEKKKTDLTMVSKENTEYFY